MSDLSQAKCKGQPHLFEATDLPSHIAARMICDTCPAIAACRELLRQVQLDTAGIARQGGGPEGTWAGQLVGVYSTPKGGRPKKPREHGSERGFQQHRNRREMPCDECRVAHNKHWREWSGRQNEEEDVA